MARLAGGSDPEFIVVADGVDTVDASAVDTSFIGRAYYGSNDLVISDLFVLLRHDAAPNDRPRIRSVSLSRAHWKFAP
jgi:hypothetical protein